MRTRSTALAGVLIGLALAVTLWWTFAGSRDESRGGAAQPTAPSATEAPAASLQTPTGDLSTPEAPSSRADAPSREIVAQQKAAVRERGGPSDDEAAWLEGAVRFPEGTPSDERVLVLAVPRSMKARELYDGGGPAAVAWSGGEDDDDLVSWVAAGPDGRFRMALPADARELHLAVSGRYLYSRATNALPYPPPEDAVRLTGELGVWVTGRLTAPANADEAEADLSGTKLELGPDITEGFDAFAMASEAYAVEGRADADGRFELRAIQADKPYGLKVETERLASHIEQGIRGEPGEHLELTLPLTRGAILTGRVLDEDGGGIEGADVSAKLTGFLGELLDELREDTTDAEGHFALEGVTPGTLRLRASHGSFEDHTLTLPEEVADGEVLEDIEITLGPGLTIAGSVRFPDGTPATNATVQPIVDYTSGGGFNAGRLARSRVAAVPTDEQGRFRVQGLLDAQYTLRASLQVDEGERAGSWSARTKKMSPPATDVEIELETLLDLAGRVEDLDGTPIADFEVRATRAGSGSFFGLDAERESFSFTDEEDGHFVCEGLRPDVWELAVVAEGFALGQAESEVPRGEDAEPLVVVLGPAAAVAGFVLDTGGTPVSGAKVTLEQDLQSRMSSMGDGGAPEVYSDLEGRFRLVGLDPGDLALVATYEGFAGSEPVPVELIGGEVVEDVVLRLRTGAILTGEVLDDEGEPTPGRMVIVQRTPNYSSQHMLTTDAEGSFHVEHLEPGKWQVIATKNFLEAQFNDDSGDADQAMGDFLENMQMDFVELVDGETHHVVLGAQAKDPVVVTGRVLHAGEPVESAFLTFVPEDAEGIGEMKMRPTKENGAFEVKLDRPGEYLVTVGMSMNGIQQNSIEFRESIPEGASEHELTLELPQARISGRVFDADGQPLSECRVTLTPDGGVPYGSFLGGHYSETTTDAEGFYDVRYLSPGSYRVAAGGVVFGGMLGGESSGGRSIQSDLEVDAGEWLEGVDFRLSPPSELVGWVRDVGGQPVANASVFVRDEQGRLLERFSLVTTDGSGKFTYSGLAEGRYSVSARLDDMASPESRQVRIDEDGGDEVTIVLEPGTILRVSVIDKSGAELRAAIRALDSNERDFAGMRTIAELLESYGQGFSSKEQRIGPLAPGRYEVVALTDDGRTVSKPVTVRGGGERKVKLRLR